MNRVIPLLADASPCLRRQVLCDLMQRPDDDPEVHELDMLRESDPLAAALLQTQTAEGSWESEAGDRIQATAQALTRLGYLGFDADLPAVQRGAAYLFSQQRSDGAWPL